MTRRPTNPKGITIAGIEATPEDSRPTPQIGESTTVNLLFEDVPELAAPGDRYEALRKYGQYAGEATHGRLLGGSPYLLEHPTDDWPVDTHVAAVVYGRENGTDDPWWGVIVGVDDETKTLGNGRAATKATGAAEQTDNIYRLSVEIVKLAPLSAYADANELLSDLSPTTNQL